MTRKLLPALLLVGGMAPLVTLSVSGCNPNKSGVSSAPPPAAKNNQEMQRRYQDNYRNRGSRPPGR